MSESKGKTVVVILAILLLVIGIAILLYPCVNALWVDYTMNRETEAFLLTLETTTGEANSDTDINIPENPEGSEAVDPQPPTEHTQLWLDMKAYNETIFQDGQEGLSDPTAYEKSPFLLTEYACDSEVFGVLSIPKLELRMPIYLGATKENMAKGAAVMGQTSIPLGGENTNCVLAGHRGWNGAAYFLYIDKLEPGDTLTVTNLWENLTYTVTETKIISPNDVEAIHIQPGRELLTLLTCHPPASGGKQRYLVFCERTYL